VPLCHVSEYSMSISCPATTVPSNLVRQSTMKPVGELPRSAELPSTPECLVHCFALPPRRGLASMRNLLHCLVSARSRGLLWAKGRANQAWGELAACTPLQYHLSTIAMRIMPPGALRTQPQVVIDWPCVSLVEVLSNCDPWPIPEF